MWAGWVWKCGQESGGYSTPCAQPSAGSGTGRRLGDLFSFLRDHTNMTAPVQAARSPQAAHESRPVRRLTTETKSAFKTTEMIAYVAAVVVVAVMSLLVKKTSEHADYFRADKAMFFIVLLTLGYLLSRGLAKAGSRDHYDSGHDHH
jgi:hypothetical protein